MVDVFTLAMAVIVSFKQTLICNAESAFSIFLHPLVAIKYMKPNLTGFQLRYLFNVLYQVTALSKQNNNRFQVSDE
jgi:hypothetical protein